jgi:nucleotide-binding universal stress UspA family protein
MGKRVLVAVDLNSVSEAAIVYGIELAARIKSPLSLIAISSSRPQKQSGTTQGLLQHDQNKWMEHAIAESQEKAVNLEIFVSSGRFFEEIMRFVRSHPAVQFIVMSSLKEKKSEDYSKFTSALKQLHEEFEGEILLVEKAGKVARASDLYV